MPHYSYKAFDRNGAQIEGDLVAASREGALQTLARRGEFPVELAEGAAFRPLQWWQRDVFGSQRLSLGTLALFTRELVSLVRADLPVDECLRLIALQPMIPQRLRQAISGVQGRVVEGEALSDALAVQGEAFPEYYWRLVRAGEVSGSLGDCLEDLATFLEKSSETRGKVAGALLYPAVLVLAAVAAIGVIMTVLVPAIAPIFKEAGAEPPLLIRWLSDVESGLREHWLLALTCIVALGMAALFAAHSPPARLVIDRLALRLPVLGGVIEKRETGRLARTLATLLRNGVPLLEAIRIASGVVTNAAMRRAAQASAEEIKEGGQLSASLVRSGLFSDLMLRMTLVGEQTGQLEVMLQRAAEIYEQALQRQMQRLTSLITPIVTLAIGALVGGLILTVMGALIAVNDLALK